jgi:hypothetical protein
MQISKMDEKTCNIVNRIKDELSLPSEIKTYKAMRSPVAKFNNQDG